MSYNPSEVGQKGSLFGLPYSKEEADLILLPVHLDVTVSYQDGTSEAPDRILDESSQLDLSLVSIEDPWNLKMAMGERMIEKQQNVAVRELAADVIDALESGNGVDEEKLDQINLFCQKVHQHIYERALSELEQGKIVGLIGGDHSSPLGLIKAIAEQQDFGILQIDAHMDLRNAYEGFHYSHASIMHNALMEKGVISLTQVGIRDFCEEEEQYVKTCEKPIHVFYDEKMYFESLQGKKWEEQVEQIISTLPSNVYVSFDMDGLVPTLCPNTGTPVPGGLEFNQVIYLFERLVRSGRTLVGFDVCECGNAAWDANVASRIIFRLATLLGASRNLLRFRKV